MLLGFRVVGTAPSDGAPSILPGSRFQAGSRHSVPFRVRAPQRGLADRRAAHGRSPDDGDRGQDRSKEEGAKSNAHEQAPSGGRRASHQRQVVPCVAARPPATSAGCHRRHRRQPPVATAVAILSSRMPLSFYLCANVQNVTCAREERFSQEPYLSLFTHAQVTLWTVCHF